MFDDAGGWEIPDGEGDGVSIRASPTFLAVPVLHAQDIEFPEDAAPDDVLPLAEVAVIVMVGEDDGAAAEFITVLRCDSGLMFVGDPEEGRVIEVPPGRVRVAVTREPVQHAEFVILRVGPADDSPAGPS